MGLAKVKSAPSYRDRIEAFGTGRFFNRGAVMARIQ